MTQEMMREMSRKEWRAYCKHMKALEKRDKEFHNLTIKELEDLTDWNREKARRYDEAAKIPIAISIVGWSITFICLIINVVIALVK